MRIKTISKVTETELGYTLLNGIVSLFCFYFFSLKTGLLSVDPGCPQSQLRLPLPPSTGIKKCAAAGQSGFMITYVSANTSLFTSGFLFGLPSKNPEVILVNKLKIGVFFSFF